jgi:hypothetical protein
VEIEHSASCEVDCEIGNNSIPVWTDDAEHDDRETRKGQAEDCTAHSVQVGGMIHYKKAIKTSKPPHVKARNERYTNR